MQGSVHAAVPQPNGKALLVDVGSAFGLSRIWDESKSRTNRKKHGVSFEEASALFYRGNDYL